MSSEKKLRFAHGRFVRNFRERYYKACQSLSDLAAVIRTQSHENK